MDSLLKAVHAAQTAGMTLLLRRLAPTLCALVVSGCPPAVEPPGESDFPSRAQGLDCTQRMGSRANRFFTDAARPQRIVAQDAARRWLTLDDGATWREIFPEEIARGTEPLEGPYFVGSALYFRRPGTTKRWAVSVDDGATFTSADFTSRSGTNAPPGTTFHATTGQLAGLTLEGRMLRSVDDGASFTAIDDGLSERGGSSLVFLRDAQLFVSTDDGFSFNTPAVPDQPREVHVFPDGRIVLNAFSGETDGNNEFALYLSADRGASWRRISPLSNPSRHIRHFALGPADNEIWAEFQVALEKPMRVLHSADLGATWEFVDFTVGTEALVWHGDEIDFERVGTRVRVAGSLAESSTRRPYPYCFASAGAGSITPRTPASANGPWAQLPFGALRAVPATALGEAFAVKNDGVYGAVSGPLAGSRISMPGFWQTHWDVTRLPGGELRVLSSPTGYAANKGAPYTAAPFDVSTGAVDEANAVPFDIIGSASMSNRRFNWRGERLYGFANGSLWVEADVNEPTLNVRGHGVVPLSGAPDRMGSYRVRSPDLAWVANPLAGASDHRIPLRPLAGLVGLEPLDCTNSTCFSLPNDEQANDVLLTTKYLFVFARSGLWAVDLSTDLATAQLKKVAEAPLAFRGAVSVPDDVDGALYFTDGDLWRLVPDFSRVAPQPE